jgi:hypothetical protein
MNPKITPKDFFLWFGAMAALYWSVVAFVFLVFDYVDYAFPNALAYRPDPYAGGMPYEMASILVLFPVSLLLLYLIRRDIARDPTRKEIWVRRWAIILTLFLAGATMAVDVITLLTAFFRGEEITAAFLIKVLVVFLVAALGFMHFTADLRGYWERNPREKRYVFIAVVVLAILAVCSGFFIVGTPQSARLARFDAQKIFDLQNIQSQVVSYWQAHQKLPAGLSDIADPLSGFTVPLDPETRASYEYKATGAYSFELCAVFNKEGSMENYNPAYAFPASPDLSASNWDHLSGRTCFSRTIDPARYPPFKK